MARGRRLDDLRNDAYKASDNEGATKRFPAAEVTRYINQGRAERYRRIVQARGRSFFRKATPQTITTSATATRYNLNADFFELISVRLDGDDGYELDPFDPQMESSLRAPAAATTYPTHYELQPATIELLPKHSAGRTVIVEYVPNITDLTADADEDDGLNGLEDYPVVYAAREMTSKDDEPGLYKRLSDRLDELRAEIAKLAPKRDRFRAERIKDTRKTRPGVL